MLFRSVGGAARDLLLGHDPEDFDVCTNATPEQMSNVFRHRNVAAVRRLFAADQTENRTFSRAIRADHADMLAGIDAERHLIQHFLRAEPFTHLDKIYHEAGECSGSSNDWKPKPLMDANEREFFLSLESCDGFYRVGPVTPPSAITDRSYSSVDAGGDRVKKVERAVPARLKRARSARSTFIWKPALPVYSTLAALEPPRYIPGGVNQTRKKLK